MLKRASRLFRKKNEDQIKWIVPFLLRIDSILRLERPKPKKELLHCVSAIFIIISLKKKSKSQVVSEKCYMRCVGGLVLMAFKWQWKACDSHKHTHRLCNISLVLFFPSIFSLCHPLHKIQKRKIVPRKNERKNAQILLRFSK